MTQQILLNLPDELSERVREIAANSDKPVEEVLLDHLKTLAPPLPALPPDEQAELDALEQLSDDALWTIAGEQMPEAGQQRAHVLMDKNNSGAMTPDEAAELESLVMRADRLMLRKAEAAIILQKRGYQFTQKDFAPKDE